MKHEKALERVYEPERRLHTAWQQVKENAGAAGIDRMTVEEFERRKDELLQLIHDKLRAGIYRRAYPLYSCEKQINILISLRM